MKNRKKASGGSIKETKYRPLPYDYLKNVPNSHEKYGTITREEYEAFKKDPTRIPEMRDKINDAAWKDVLNQFENDPNLAGLDMGNIKLPYGTGDRALGKYMSTPDKLNPLEVGTGNAPTAIEVNGVKVPEENIVQKSNKVNGYNYSAGRPYNKFEKMIGKNKTKYKEGGDLGKTLLDAVPYVGSLLGTIFNKKSVDKIQTNRKPALVKYNPTAYDSNLDTTLSKNNAAYSGVINSNDPGLGTVNKNLAFSTLLEGNTKAGMADSQAENAFNSNEGRVAAQVALSNAQSINVANEGNINRYNDKVVAGNQAINAGVQDMLNIDSNRQARNMQGKEMGLKFLENADNGTIARVAKEMGFDNPQDFIDMLNNPNQGFGPKANKRNRRNKYSTNNTSYNPVMGSTGD